MDTLRSDHPGGGFAMIYRTALQRKARFAALALATGIALGGCAALPGTPARPSATAAIARSLEAVTPSSTPTPAPPAATATPQPTALASPTALPSEAPTVAPLPSNTAALPTGLPPSPSATPQATAPAPGVRSAPTVTPASPSPAPLPVIDIIVDDGGDGFGYSGAWFTGDGGASYGGGCHWAPPGHNIAYITPELPLAGSYEIYAWGCGDPNHDQAYLTTVMVYPFSRGFYAPPQTAVNLKEDVGRWVSLGIYYMEPGGSLSVGTSVTGNVAVDAFRFVYRFAEHLDITPTPAPTRITWTNHPPSPQEQLTAGDLSARLGLVQWLYPHTPAQFEEATFDDCEAFPRDGCGGTRPGWQVLVEYRGREPFSVAYRLSADLRHVSLDAPEVMRDRQLLYLSGRQGEWHFYAYRYPDGSWRFVSTNLRDNSGSSGSLTDDQAARLRDLVDRYASIGTGREQLVTPDGFALSLYGLGTRVALDEAGRASLIAFVGEFAVYMPQ